MFVDNFTCLSYSFDMISNYSRRLVANNKCQTNFLIQILDGFLLQLQFCILVLVSSQVMIDSLHLCLPCHICCQYSFRVDHPISKYWNRRNEWIVFLCVISSIMCGQRTMHCIERKCHFHLLHRLQSFAWNTICLLALCRTTSTPP